MSDSNNVVLSCIDDSPVSEAVCDYASWLAEKTGAPLKLLHTIEHGATAAISDFSGALGFGSREDLLNELTDIEQSRTRLLIQNGQLMLKAAKERIEKSGVTSPELCQRHGSLGETLIELEDKIRVLVIGVPGVKEMTKQPAISGSTEIESVVRALHKPILVVNKTFSKPQRVMLAYDGSPSCKKALDMVCSSPLFKDLPVHVVHVGDQGEAMLKEASGALAAAGIDVQSKQIDGKIEDVLARYQDENDIDLMLMGAFSHNRIRGFLWGSFTAKMLEKTQRPLLLLR